MHAYPHQLAGFVLDQWRDAADTGTSAEDDLDPAVLHEILSAAYQATLLREEDRPVTFRAIFADPDVFAADAGPPDGLHRLAFEHPRPLSAHELRRLSLAAKFNRSLLGIHRGSEGALEIWGILHSGPRWLQSVQGGRGAGQLLPPVLVVSGTGPGRLTVSKGSIHVAKLVGGQVTGPLLDVFDSRWLPDLFATVRNDLQALHDQTRASRGADWACLDADLTRLVAQHMIRRVISTMRSRHHGGTLIVVPSDVGRRLLSEQRSVRVKYTFRDEEPRRRFRTLLVGIMNRLAEAHVAPARVGWNEYAVTTDATLQALDEAVFEVSHLIAAAADVDGAVLLTRGFELLGFGGVIGSELPEVNTVHQALDVEGTLREEETTDGVGTRHRSVYRLCLELPSALAIVVSQDDTVRFVRRVGDDVLYWDQATLSALDV
jgi:hypothetical protein